MGGGTNFKFLLTLCRDHLEDLGMWWSEYYGPQSSGHFLQYNAFPSLLARDLLEGFC